MKKDEKRDPLSTEVDPSYFGAGRRTRKNRKNKKNRNKRSKANKK